MNLAKLQDKKKINIQKLMAFQKLNIINNSSLKDRKIRNSNFILPLTYDPFPNPGV